MTADAKVDAAWEMMFLAVKVQLYVFSTTPIRPTLSDKKHVQQTIK